MLNRLLLILGENVIAFWKIMIKQLFRINLDLIDIHRQMYKIMRLKGNVAFQSGEKELDIECFSKCLEIENAQKRLFYIAESHYSFEEV